MPAGSSTSARWSRTAVRDPVRRSVRITVATWNIRRGGLRRRVSLARALARSDPTWWSSRRPRSWRRRRHGEAAGASVVLGSANGRWRCSPVRAWARPRRTGTSWGSRDVAESGSASRPAGARRPPQRRAVGRPERRRLAEIERVLASAGPPPGPGRTMIVGDLNAIAPGELPSLSRLPMWIRFVLRVDGGIGTAAVEKVLRPATPMRSATATGPGRFDDAGDGPQRPARLPDAGPALRVASRRAPPDLDPALLAAASDHLRWRWSWRPRPSPARMFPGADVPAAAVPARSHFGRNGFGSSPEALRDVSASCQEPRRPRTGRPGAVMRKARSTRKACSAVGSAVRATASGGRRRPGPPGTGRYASARLTTTA